MPKELSTSVIVKYTDPERIEKAVQKYALELKRRYPEVKRIMWFGSWVHGIPQPGSDVDLCLILTTSDLRRRERIPRYLPGGFPTGMDLFAYTEEEFMRLEEENPGWHRCILSGIEL